MGEPGFLNTPEGLLIRCASQIGSELIVEIESCAFLDADGRPLAATLDADRRDHVRDVVRLLRDVETFIGKQTYAEPWLRDVIDGRLKP